MRACYMFLLLSLSRDWQLAILAISLFDADRHYRHQHNSSRLRTLCEQQNHRCCYCGVRFVDSNDNRHPRRATIEHVIRKVDGGPATWENEVAACGDCNSRRNTVDAYSFYRDRTAVEANRRAAQRAARRRQKHRKRQAARRAKGGLSNSKPRTFNPPRMVPPA